VLVELSSCVVVICPRFNMQRFGWYRHRVVNKKEIPSDTCAGERETLRKYKVYVRTVGMSIDRFDKTLSNLNLWHNDLNRSTEAFFYTSPRKDQIDRVQGIGESLININASYGECRDGFTNVRNRQAKITDTIKALEKRLKDRDYWYWEKVHYSAKVDKLKAKNRSNLENVEKNLKKLANAENRYDAIDSQVMTDVKSLNSERYDEVESLLQMYLAQLDKYYSGIYKKMNSVATKEEGVVNSFKLTPLDKRGGLPVPTKSVMREEFGSRASTVPSGTVTFPATKTGTDTVNQSVVVKY